MNSLSPRLTAIYIAIFSALVIVAGIAVTFYLKVDNIYAVALIAALTAFITVYVFTSSFINNIIFEKISPIYKTIQNINVSKKDITKNMEDRDILKAVKKDVILWAKKKTLEITQLQQLEKYRREFLGNVSHELKTPIFNIQGYVLTLLDGGIEDSSINRLYLERTEKSINRLISIVNDLESISKLESGELKLNLTKCNIIKLFEETFEIHDMMAAERGIKLRFARKFDKNIFVLADREKILEAINNLITNSIKYGKEKGLTTVDFVDITDSIMIEVTDDGPGIREEDIPRIFERFYRADKSRSREMGGTGLGLSIVKHIIEAHEQTINVRSKPAEGTTFTFTLTKA